jgi:uncharacterized membrane protein YcjF (UPF0283 family)
MRRPDDGLGNWEERTGILNIPTRLIRWFSGIFTAVWLILIAISSYNSVSAHSGQSWDAQAVGIIAAGASNIGIALPVAYVLTEVIDMVFGSWYRQRTRERARAEGLEAGKKAGRKQGMHEQQERWLQWLDRRQRAEESGRPFDEPPPGLNGAQPTEE